MPGYIHHLQWSVSNFDDVIKTLTEHWAGQIIARRKNEIVIKIGAALMLVSEKHCDAISSISEYPYLQCCLGHRCPHKDSVFNICLEVEDVAEVCARMEKNGSSIIIPTTSVTSKEGSITYAIVTSPCDNVLHSLVNTYHYRGVFLPGFSEFEDDQTSSHSDAGLSHIDHITYVCHYGESNKILDWYRNTCGMTRFKITSTEEEDGIEVDGDAALRLKVGEWMSEWMCRENGVRSGEGSNERNFKLVLAEPLCEKREGHVSKFLEQFPGSGVQHLGLCTDNIQKTVTILNENGVQFRTPPPAYYNLDFKQMEFSTAQLDFKPCRKLGILIDKEEEEMVEKFLLQIFSKPIFSMDTFFMEVIQRKGAKGFGSGNIKALALSIVIENDTNRI